MELMRRIPDQEIIWGLDEEEQMLLDEIRRVAKEIDEEDGQ